MGPLLRWDNCLKFIMRCWGSKNEERTWMIDFEVDWKFHRLGIVFVLNTNFLINFNDFIVLLNKLFFLFM